MQKTSIKRLLASLLAAVVGMSALASCGGGNTTSSSSGESGSSSQAESSDSDSSASGVPLVVAYDTFNQKFNPFYYTVAYDGDVASVCIDTLLTNDRSGEMVLSGIEGETRTYNGTEYTYDGLADCEIDQGEDTTTYTFKLREGVKFADGEELNADDLIFSLYVVLDPTYTGIITLYSEDIVGLQAYRTQTSDELYEKYGAMYDYFEANGDAGEYGEDMLASYDAAVKQAWTDDLQGIVDNVYQNYAADVASYMPEVDTAALDSSEELKIAYAMLMWSFGSYDSGVLTATDSGETFDIAGGSYPTMEDFYEEVTAKYATAADYDAAGESATGSSVTATAKSDFIVNASAEDESSSESGVPNISGIKKVDDYTVSVTTNGFSATTIYKLAGVPLAPMHYYGDESKYDYEDNQFGFDFGDLSGVENNLEPMGTGPYQLDKYENRTVYLAANENYWKGAPKIKEMQWKETQESDKTAAVGTGTADMAEPQGSIDTLAEISSYNSNGETTGDKLTTYFYDMLGYGLIGINAHNVNVGGEPDSDASKNLRKGFATILAVYRDIAMTSYYGDAAKVIEYSTSASGWAYPSITDPDYKVAYSTDVDGNPIYTDDMTDEERYAAALEAAKGFFMAAGYTWDDATGKFTAAPEGAKMSYEVLIGGGGTGDHPDFLLLEYAREALDSIGITLVINDPSDTNEIWNAKDANTTELWVQSWSLSLDPDPMQIWHSRNVPGLPGSTGSNGANLVDEKMDELIMESRSSSETEYRKAILKQVYELILDWGVEVPVFQRQNIYVFSSERVNIDTITPDITTYWDWMHDLEKLEMN